MATSQNGWSASKDRAALGIVTIEPVPGIRLAVRGGDVATVLGWAVRRWHTEVEPLVVGWCWGWAYRDVRGAADLSNHASGTAIDLNAPWHVLGEWVSRDPDFTAAEIAAVRRIVTDSGGVIRWGGDYTTRQDGMHLEINASAAAVSALARRITAPTAPPVEPTRPAVLPPTPKDDTMVIFCEKLGVTALYSGGVLTGLGAGGAASAKANVDRGTVCGQWVEEGDFLELARKSALLIGEGK